MSSGKVAPQGFAAFVMAEQANWLVVRATGAKVE